MVGSRVPRWGGGKGRERGRKGRKGRQDVSTSLVGSLCRYALPAHFVWRLSRLKSTVSMRVQLCFQSRAVAGYSSRGVRLCRWQILSVGDAWMGVLGVGGGILV